MICKNPCKDCDYYHKENNTCQSKKCGSNSDGYYPYCSHCKNEPENGKMTKWCPECGAKMDKE